MFGNEYTTKLKQYDKDLYAITERVPYEDENGLTYPAEFVTVFYKHPKGLTEEVVTVRASEYSPTRLCFEIAKMDRWKGEKKDWSFQKDIVQHNNEVRKNNDGMKEAHENAKSEFKRLSKRTKYSFNY